MSVTKTTLYCPDDSEALIAETLDVVLDGRVIEISIRAAPYKYHEGPSPRKEDESDIAYARRRWSSHLPTTDTNDRLLFREEWGWTEDEIHFVIHALEQIRTHLVLSSKTASLEGTVVTLLRDSERVRLLMWRWKNILTEGEAG
jgi:hypothetical protein